MFGARHGLKNGNNSFLRHFTLFQTDFTHFFIAWVEWNQIYVRQKSTTKQHLRKKKRFREWWKLGQLFTLTSQVCVHHLGICSSTVHANILDGSKSGGLWGSKKAPDPMWAPEENLKPMGSAFPQLPWQCWTLSWRCHIDEADSLASCCMSAGGSSPGSRSHWNKEVGSLGKVFLTFFPPCLCCWRKEHSKKKPMFSSKS